MFDTHPIRIRIASRIVVSLGLTLLALVTLFGAARAQSPAEPVVRPDPATITATSGQTVTVQFVAEGVENLYGADVRAKFDPAVLEAVDDNPAQDGVQIAPGSFLKPDFVVRQVADNAAGTIWYATTQVSPTLPVSGAGALFSVTLHAKAGVANCPITITSVELVDRSGRALAARPQSQQTVTATVVATPTQPASTAAPLASTAAPSSAQAAAAVGAAASPGQGAAEAGPTTVPGRTSAALPPLCAPPGIVILALGTFTIGGVGWWARRRSAR